MSKRITTRERLIIHYKEQRIRMNGSTPYVKLLSSEEQIIDGEVYIEESWQKNKYPVPCIDYRRYKKGTAVNSRPMRDDLYILPPVGAGNISND